MGVCYFDCFHHLCYLKQKLKQNLSFVRPMHHANSTCEINAIFLSTAKESNLRLATVASEMFYNIDSLAVDKDITLGIDRSLLIACGVSKLAARIA